MTKPKRKPYLSDVVAQLQEENSELRRTKAYMEIEIAILRRDLISANQALADWQQRTARNGEWR